MIDPKEITTPVTTSTAVKAPAAPAPAVPMLSVAQSVLGKTWVASKLDERLAEGISQSFDLPLVVARLLAARGVAFEDVKTFMNPTLKAQLPDPYVLKDMEVAAERIADAVMAGEQIAVFGDYDVDGATSTAVLHRFFGALGQKIRFYIPDRIDEGYGLNIPALLKLQCEGAKVLITVDCGITAFDAVKAGAEAGLDMIILDHHRAEPHVPPEAVAVVNPNRLDCESGLGQLAAVGVAFLTIVAVNRVLRSRGFYTNGQAEPRILQWLDIVALGTVCDVVPLTGINRAFVAQGLRVMAMRQNPGLVALADIAGVSEAPSTFHAGFVFGPRINAGGRVGEAYLGAHMLSTNDPLEARTLASKLHAYNADRKMIEEAVLEEAMEMAAALADNNVIVVAGEGWHPGVIGIVASRIKEKFNRPSCVVTFDEEGVGKASARSVNIIDLGGAVIAAKQKGLLVAGGGHKMAAGFTVMRDKLEALRAFLNDHALGQLKGAPYHPELRFDAVLSVHGLSLDLVEKLNMLSPFGAGNAEPRFALAGAKIVKATVVGEKHVSCFIQDTSGGASIKGIAFRAMDSELGPLLLKSGGKPLHLAGHVSINNWQGKKSVQFQIIDAAHK